MTHRSSAQQSDPRNLERELDETRARLDTVLEHNLDGLLVLDTCGVVLLANGAASQLFGRPAEQLTGCPLGHPIAPHNHVAEIDIRRPDGETVVAEMHVARTTWDGAPALMASLRDITMRRSLENQLRNMVQDLSAKYEVRSRELEREVVERRRAEEQLRARNRELDERVRERTRDLEATRDFLQLILNTIPTPVFYKNADGQYTGCNLAFEDLIGRSREEILGRTVCDLWPEHLAKVYEEADRRLMLARGRQVYETRVRTGTGEEREVLLHKATFSRDGLGSGGIVGVVVDLTERNRAEAEQRRMATAVEHAAEAIVVTDTTGLIQYVNPAFETVTGYTADEAIGKFPSLLRSGHHDDAFYRELWTTIESGRTWTGRFVNRRKDGTLYQEDATISCMRDRDGAIVGYVGVKRDVSHEVQLERQLRHAQKMEAIGTLAGGIAHDFNNVLYAILGFSEMAMDELEPGGKPRRCMERVVQATQRAAELVNQILTISRRTEKERVPLLMQSVVKEALRLLKGTLPASIRLRTRIDEHCPAVLADPTHVHQVIMNLCTNAYHAMRLDGGELRVTLAREHVDAAPAERIADVAPGDWVVLRVHDTGHGMTPDVLERIFEPYFSTKPPGEGTGLGLAVVHGIVRDIGGSIHVDSRAGKGTVFSVFLPIHEGPPEERPGAASPKLEIHGSERVMVVDDEEPVLNLTHQALQRLGYQVTTFSDPRAALRAWQAEPETFDVIVTDQTMPELLGFDMARTMLGQRPETRIILCTGYSEMVSEDRARAGGLMAYLRKPVSMSRLAATIREVADRRSGEEHA